MTHDAEAGAPRAGALPLARIALVVYVLLVVYASLYPLEGWHDLGLSPFAYLTSPWPRAFFTLDAGLNILGYLPYGFLCVLAFHPSRRALAAFAIAVASAAVLSISLEAAQTYLPSRDASKLDVLCNLVGAACGGALAVLTAPSLLAGPIHRLRSAAFLEGTDIDFGLALLALWLFMQLNPATLLFAAGDLRDWLPAASGRARAPQFFVGIEAFIAAANLVSVSLLLSALARPRRWLRTLFLALVLAAIGVKSAAFAVLMHAENVFIWLTPGAQFGLVVGIVVALAALALPRVARLAAAAVLLMAATVLVNVAPANPYLSATLKLWQQGYFLNFNGVTRLVSALWAYVALGYLMLLAARRRDAVG
jgi:VanZ family protein